MKYHVKSIQKGYNSDKYMVHNLTWSVVFLRSTLPSALIQKVLKLVPLISTGPEFYVATMNTVIYDQYAYLVETLNHTKSLKLRDHPGDNVADFWNTILVDDDFLESAGPFNTDHLGYIIHISEQTSDSRLHLWATQKYKEVMEFIKKTCVCDEDVMQPDDIITYVSLVQEAMHEYCSIVDSKQW